MKNFLIGVAVAILAMGLGLRIARAQGATAATWTGSGPHSTCTSPATGLYYLCLATDGIWVSNNGAAYFQVTAPGAVSTTLTINGTTKTLPASFTIAASPPTMSAPTASAPAVTAN